MKAPDFWEQGKAGWRSVLLTPLACLYAAGGALRQAMTTPTRATVPVLCVGNLTAGGSGKTPVVIALARAAADRGIRAAVVSRGYGGAVSGPVKVDPARHVAGDVGDEPLLIARHAETWVAKNRVAGAQAAADAGAQLILLDDGFQNPTLHKDLSVIVIDGGFGFGNGRVIPAGPMREKMRTALKRADLVLLIGRDDAGVRDVLLAAIPVEAAEIQPEPSDSLVPGDRCVAFAGIGIPAKFFATLRAAGFDVLAERPFPDHFMYSNRDLDRLLAEAAAGKAKLVTTAKDRVRLPPDRADKVAVLEISLKFERQDLPSTLIDRVMNNG